MIENEQDPPSPDLSMERVVGEADRVKGALPGEVGPRLEQPGAAGGIERGVKLAGESTFLRGFRNNARTPYGIKLSIPLFSGKDSNFSSWSKQALFNANAMTLGEVFVHEKEVPVANAFEVTSTLITEGLDERGIFINRQARRFLSLALKTPHDLDILNRSVSPSPADLWRQLAQWYASETNGATKSLYQSLTQFSMSLDSDPVLELEKLDTPLDAWGCQRKN